MNQSVLNVLDYAEAVAAGLDAIEEFTHVGGEKAHLALSAIRAVVGALKPHDHSNSKQKEVDVKKAIDELRSALADNDDAALAALHARFSK